MISITLKNINLSLSQENLDIIDKRLSEFQKLNSQPNEHWFSELCFCLLTANSQAKKAIAIQSQVGIKGFLENSQEDLATVIRNNNHRFHNTKAKYIVKAREFHNIKDLLIGLTGLQAREFLVKNITGLGYKESSHFLRNIGFSDVAIIDRHIIKFLVKYNLIDSVPKVVTKKIYLEAERILASFGMPLDRLDLIIWCFMTGTVLK